VNLFAQEDEIQFNHITAEDGLSLNIVTEVFQDSKGFLWFGTYNGLNRFDGYSFKIFQPDPSNSKSISSHSILDIYEDSKGYIWIATSDGLNKFDWKTEDFIKYRNNPKDSNSLSYNYIYSVFEDSERTIWIGTSYGLNKYNEEKDNFTVIKVNEAPNLGSPNAITSITEDLRGNIWVGTWDGLYCLKKDGTIVSKFTIDEKNPNSLSSNEISVMLVDNEENFWIGTNGGGINRYDFKTGYFIHYKADPKNPFSISSDFINDIYQDKLNNLWIGTKDGLNKFDWKHKRFSKIFHDPLKPLSIINNDILSINEDETGIIWIGSSGGISRFNQSTNKFNYYREDKSNPEVGISSNRVNAVFIDSKKNIWVGTKNGLDKINKEENQIIHYKNIPNVNSLNDNYVKSVVEDHNGIIWIGTDEEGLNRLNPVTGEFKAYKYISGDNESLSNDGVPALCEDRNGNLWVGTYNGLSRFDKSSEKFIRYSPDPSNPNSLKNGIIWVIYEDSEGMLWMGTDGGGVSKFNPKTNVFKTYLFDSTNNSGLRIYSIIESKDKLMWFGTTEGLNCYNRKTGEMILYTKEDGLPSNAVNSIVEDDNGNLWISSDKGLSKFDRKAGIFQTYTKRDGLMGNDFCINAVLKAENNVIYFGASDGLLFFNPRNIKDVHLTARVVFTDLKIYNQSVTISTGGNSILKESITGAKSISIPYENDVITIDFALLDYFNVKRNRFVYKLEGFEKEWNDVGKRNSATYTNLPPGEYTFYVKAFHGDGGGDLKETSIDVIIVPAFYQTWWFKIIVALGLFFFTVIIFRGKTRKITNENKILESRVTERTKALDKTIDELSQEIEERKKAEEKVQASLKENEIHLKEKEVLLKEIHHRVKNNLQVISSLLYLNSKKINDSKALDIFKDSQNRVKSIALVHERLYQSKDLGKIDFNDYVQKLTKDLLRSYAVNQSVIQLDININNVFINIDMAVPCGLIINELISNSLKYAFPNYEDEKKNGIIKIDFNPIENNKLILIVSDNGIGIQGNIDEKKNNSLGLQLVETLVAQLDGTMELALNSGTTFKIKI